MNQNNFCFLKHSISGQDDLHLSASTVKKIKETATDHGLSMSAVIERLIDAEYKR